MRIRNPVRMPQLGKALLFLPPGWSNCRSINILPISLSWSRTSREPRPPGPNISLLGIQPDGSSIEWNKFIWKGLKMKGIYGREIFETWHKMDSMIRSGLNIAPIITHRLPYTEFREGFEAMNSGKSGKVVLDWIV